MKLFRKILYPFVPLYYVAVFFRNKFYDWSIFSSKSYEFPLICVGNLSTGGTGKTPMIEYLISVLTPKFQIATLSRGYGRDSKGFLIAGPQSTSKNLGDEPFQIYNKFKNITVSVDADRQHGLNRLIEKDPLLDVVLLDDAFQDVKPLKEKSWPDEAKKNNHQQMATQPTQEGMPTFTNHTAKVDSLQ